MYDHQTFDRLLGSTPPGETPLTPEFSGKKVIVHYWTEYNKGKHFFIEVEAGPEYTVLDLMYAIHNHVLKTHELKKEIECYVIRNANKEGYPKIDIPIFETGQKIQNLGFVRFVLCDADLDTKARKKMEETTYEDEPVASTNDTEIKSSSFWKKCFCCQ